MEKYTFEYNFNASAKLLFAMLSTVDGLNLWFADKVSSTDDIFHFTWDDTELTAKITHKKELEMVHFTWINGESDKYFEFRINTDSISNEISLLITDFAFENELKEKEMIWNSAVNKLMHAIGSRFSNINT